MDVLLIDSVSSMGGPKLYTDMIFERFSNMGIHVYLENVQPVDLTTRFLRDKQKDKKVGECLSKKYSGKIDLVHSVGTIFFFSRAGHVISKNLEIPHVVSVHGLIIDEFLFAKGRSFKSFCIGKILEYYEKKTLKQADAIITFSNFEKETIEKKIGNLPIKVAYHGCDHIPRVNLPKKRRGISYYVGTQPYRKGLDLFQEIASTLSKIKFTVYGSSPSRTKTISPKNVTYSEYIKGVKEYYSKLANSQLLINPSRHDSFCITALEAMKLGIIPIVSEYSGVKEVMNGVGEVLPLDVGLWLQSIKRLYPSVDEALRRKTINIAEKYTWQKSVEEHVKIYRSTTSRIPKNKS